MKKDKEDGRDLRQIELVSNIQKNYVLPNFPVDLFWLPTKNRLKKIAEVLSDKLIYHEIPQKKWIDRVADWLSRKIRLETTELAHK